LDHYDAQCHLIAKQTKLLNTRLSELVKDRKEVISVSYDTRLQEVFDVLAKNRFIAVPVRHNELEPSYVGIVSILDIIGSIFLDEPIAAQPEITQEELLSYWNSARNKPVGTTLGFTKESDFLLYFYHYERLHKVLDPFHKGYHRVLVGTPEEVRYLSQSDVVSFICQHMEQLGEVKKYKARTLINADRKLITVIPSQTAWSAFRKMASARTTVAPVLDEHKKIVANLSVSDIRSLTTETLPDLLLPVSEYLKKYHRWQIPKVISVGPMDTLETILPKIVENRIHNIWVLDTDGKLIGLVSLTDIIRSVFLEANLLEKEKNPDD